MPRDVALAPPGVSDRRATIPTQQGEAAIAVEVLNRMIRLPSRPPCTSTRLSLPQKPRQALLAPCINAEPAEATGFNDPNGGSWDAYMRTEGTGTTFLSPSGTPASTYDELRSEIVGFNGFATHGFDAGNGVAAEGQVDDAGDAEPHGNRASVLLSAADGPAPCTERGCRVPAPRARVRSTRRGGHDA